jgi:hypothetical protein
MGTPGADIDKEVVDGVDGAVPGFHDAEGHEEDEEFGDVVVAEDVFEVDVVVAVVVVVVVPAVVQLEYLVHHVPQVVFVAPPDFSQSLLDDFFGDVVLLEFGASG